MVRWIGRTEKMVQPVGYRASILILEQLPRTDSGHVLAVGGGACCLLLVPTKPSELRRLHCVESMTNPSSLISSFDSVF